MTTMSGSARFAAVLALIVSTSCGGSDTPKAASPSTPTATATATTPTPTATATRTPTPTPDDAAFMAAIADLQFGNRDMSDPAWTQLAVSTCAGLEGMTPEGIPQDINALAEMGGSKEDSAALLKATIKYYCPQYQRLYDEGIALPEPEPSPAP